MKSKNGMGVQRGQSVPEQGTVTNPFDPSPVGSDPHRSIARDMQRTDGVPYQTSRGVIGGEPATLQAAQTSAVRSDPEDPRFVAQDGVHDVGSETIFGCE